MATATDPPNLIRLIPAKEAGQDDSPTPPSGGPAPQEVLDTMASTDSAFRTPAATPDTTWRTRDITVTAVIGVAFGVVFWAWGFVWHILDPIPGTQELLYGIWLVPAVLAPLIVRKPGAALFAEMVAAGLSALLGSQWGVDTLLSGFVQGAAAELVFAFTVYRVWSLPVLAVAALASAAAAWAHDWVVWYPQASNELQAFRAVTMAISTVVFAGFGSRALVTALRRAGVLEGFPR